MNKAVKTIISVILIITLALCGFFAGRQFTEKVPLDDPIRVTSITLNTEGVSADDCVKLINNGNIPSRLVENLMLLCTPDDLLMSMDVEKTGANTFVVEIAMDEEGNMVYFADELAWILQEESQNISEGSSVTIADRKTLTVTFEEQPDVMMSYVLTAFGGVLGILFSLLIVLLTKKKTTGKYAGM